MIRVGRWVLGLDGTYRSRNEDRDLVLWKPGRTVLAAAGGRPPEPGRTNEVLLAGLLRGADPGRRTVLRRGEGRVLRHADLLREAEEGGGHRWAVYANVLADGCALLQLALYFDLRRDLEWAQAVVLGAAFDPPDGDGAVEDVEETGEHGHLVLATRRTVGPDRAPVLYACCEEPDHASDSGWRFFAGDEPEEEMDDPDQVLACSLTRFLEGDPGLRDLVVDQAEGAWERDAPGAPWRRVGGEGA